MKAAALARGMGGLFYGLVLLLIGGLLVAGGARLIVLGGSLYYLPAGLCAVLAGIAVLGGKWRVGATLYLGLMAATLVWALAEVGLDGWALAPRLISPAVLGLPFLLGALLGGVRTDRRIGFAAATAGALVVLAVWLASGFQPVRATPRAIAEAVGEPSGDWLHFANVQAGTHFSPLTQIDRDNVAGLEQVWSVRFGPMPALPLSQVQTVPLKVGDHLYACTPFSEVMDIEPDTGRVRWSYQPPRDNTGIYVSRCRGMAYYAVPGASGHCAQRVFVAVADGQLVGLDAQTGTPCPSFGEGGRVDLLKGIRQRNPGYYSVTSAPTVADGKLVIGGNIADGQYVGEPSGVVRAYDAVTGKLAWAWDLGNPDNRGEPQDGGAYTSGTPNVWAPMSADEALGLVYVPTGNATPDYWGGHRSDESNRYASSLVALDAATGQPRWSFQTTHYDVWDYDVASQPVLFDLDTPQGPVPAVMQPTKRGQLFVLDRRTGKPLFPVVEKPAPQSGAVERLSPTQPWSVALPDLAGPRLTEASMWGLSALDQLWCRIKFREARYDGSLTPPGVTSSIADPGYLGGVNWGSASIDTQRQLAFLLSNRVVNYIRLVPRSDPAARGLKASSVGELGGLVPQEGTPYAADIHPFLSPIGVPCQAPPHGMINVVDLKTGKMAWSRPLGTARDVGPIGMPSHLPFTIGTPLFGGPMGTAGGLVFSGGSQDHALRAFDSESGKLLFQGDLPGSAAAKPMSFRSDRTGRQYIVIASEAPRGKDGMAYGAITAFALPRQPGKAGQ